MKIFASHSQRMDFNWAKCGPADAPEFYEKAHQAVLDIKDGKIVDFTELDNLINEMENSADILLEQLSKDYLNEGQLMLEQVQRIAKTARVAVTSLKNNQMDSELKNMRQEIQNNSSKAVVSELCAVLFIDEVIKLYEK